MMPVLKGYTNAFAKSASKNGQPKKKRNGKKTYSMTRQPKKMRKKNTTAYRKTAQGYGSHVR
jgi:hypothetical protein